jgi:hypothetical protein
MDRDENLTKVHIDLPNHWATGGESLWVLDLGDDLYELRNVPFYAYGLNFGDVVRATPDNPELKPEVRAVVRPSGHQTLRVFFEKSVTEERILDLLNSLRPLDASFERATRRYFALDLEPGADIVAIRGELDRWQREGLADYETCEARQPGSLTTRQKRMRHELRRRPTTR